MKLTTPLKFYLRKDVTQSKGKKEIFEITEVNSKGRVIVTWSHEDDEGKTGYAAQTVIEALHSGKWIPTN